MYKRERDGERKKHLHAYVIGDAQLQQHNNKTEHGFLYTAMTENRNCSCHCKMACYSLPAPLKLFIGSGCLASEFVKVAFCLDDTGASGSELES